MHAGAAHDHESLCAMIAERREWLEREVARVGAILFRGFSVTDAGALAKLVEAAGGESMRYVGGDSPRTNVGGNVYTSTECPPSVRIPLHNELSYAKSYPRHLWFACVRPARKGGETTVADARAIWRDLDAETKQRFSTLGVRYRYSFRGHSVFWDMLDRVCKVTKSWMEALETTDRRVADEHSRSVADRHVWLPSGRLVLEIDRPATIVHPITKEQSWFNQAHVFRLNARYLGALHYTLARMLFFRPHTRSHHASFGDGSDIDEPTIDRLFDVMEAHTVPIRWEAGDVLWLDNLACMHGRNPFRGERRVLVTMSR
jgi:alpha-ketoglutarate-dependent taurine dioxygenase